MPGSSRAGRHQNHPSAFNRAMGSVKSVLRDAEKDKKSQRAVSLGHGSATACFSF